MKYLAELEISQGNPEKVEALYQSARQKGEESEFRADLQGLIQQSPEDVLLKAWKYRFESSPMPALRRKANWGLAVVLGLLTGLVFWALFNPDVMTGGRFPTMFIVWAPIATLFALVYLTQGNRQNLSRSLLVAAVLAAASIYALLIMSGVEGWNAKAYNEQMVIHLPLLSWIGIGMAVTGLRSTVERRFAFLGKSIEVIIAAGVFLAFGVAFGMITVGMFAALNITLPEIFLRGIYGGGFGLLPVLALAAMYDPRTPPEGQDFNQGLSKFIFTVVRLFLPLTLLVLVVYIFVIPFNFLAPFQDRDVLIVYNVMLFALVGLLMAVTPLQAADLSPRTQKFLRRGIIAVATLGVLIGLYALSAVVYRTVTDQITMNRLSVIGWNVINITILKAIAYTQLRGGLEGWAERLQRVFSKATTAYLVWTLFVIFVPPLIFR